MSALENSGSLQIELIRKWQRGFREKNFDILSEHLHEEFRHHTYPRSLNIPEENKEAWLKHTQERINMVTSVEIVIHSVIEAPGKVVLHATTESKDSLKMEVKLESTLIFHIVPDASGTLKIKQLEYFTDSKVYSEFTQALAAAKAKVG